MFKEFVLISFMKPGVRKTLNKNSLFSLLSTVFFSIFVYNNVSFNSQLITLGVFLTLSELL